MALMIMTFYVYIVMFFKQKTAYEMLISDWSSDVCSSDLPLVRQVIAGIDHAQIRRGQVVGQPGGGDQGFALEIDHRCLPLPSAAPACACRLRLPCACRQSNRTLMRRFWRPLFSILPTRPRDRKSTRLNSSH